MLLRRRMLLRGGLPSRRSLALRRRGSLACGRSLTLWCRSGLTSWRTLALRCRCGLASWRSLTLRCRGSLAGWRNLMLWCRSGLTSWWALALRGRSGSAWASLRPLMLGLWRCLTVRERLALRLRGCRHLVLLRCRRGHRPGSGLTWGSSGWLIATSRLGHIGATGLGWNILPGSSRQGAHRYGGRWTNVVVGW